MDVGVGAASSERVLLRLPHSPGKRLRQRGTTQNSRSPLAVSFVLRRPQAWRGGLQTRKLRLLPAGSQAPLAILHLPEGETHETDSETPPGWPRDYGHCAGAAGRRG